MNQEKQIRFIRGLKEQIEQRRNIDSGFQLRLPTSTYTDPERAKQEWDVLFKRTPQIVGLSVDLAEPGSFFTLDDLGVPILCTRAEDGMFRAFLNVCRHRGHIVEPAQSGRKRVFACPFHAWTYKPTGELQSLPRETDFGNVDKACSGLVELSSAERRGLLWVCVDPTPEVSVDELVAEIGPELDSWNLLDVTPASETRWDTACNWKSTIDTYGETYHFTALHKDTVAQTFYGHATQYEAYGPNHVMVFANHRIDQVVTEPEDDWRVVRAGIPVYFLFPNVQLAFLGGVVALIRIYPCGEDPNHSYSKVTYYQHKQNLADARDTFGQATEVLEFAQIFGNVIDGEDYPAAVSTHRGAAALTGGHFLIGRNEPPVQHFHQVCRKALGLPALETL